ncbi:hypothetical protein [Celeribacter sp.]|uniref:hypothetical protein n=1 Tax=Celeribacter sp. TaxID=1890673 RepID=UPI003A917F6B
MMGLIGPLGLALRVGLFTGAGWLAEHSDFISWRPASGDLTVNVEGLAEFLAAGIAFGGAVVWRKIAKAKGGTT